MRQAGGSDNASSMQSIVSSFRPLARRCAVALRTRGDEDEDSAQAEAQEPDQAAIILGQPAALAAAAQVRYQFHQSAPSEVNTSSVLLHVSIPPETCTVQRFCCLRRPTSTTCILLASVCKAD